MSYGSTTSTTNTGTDVPDWQKPYIQGGLGEAAALYEGGPPTAYGGSSVAGASPETIAAQKALSDFWGLPTWAQPNNLFTQSRVRPPGTVAPPADTSSGAGTTPPAVGIGDPGGGPGAASLQPRFGGTPGPVPAPVAGNSSQVYNPNPVSAGAGLAGSPGGNFLGATNQAANFGLFDVLDPASNAYLQAYAQAAIRPNTQNLMDTVLPGIKSEAIGSGNLGSTRQGIAEGLAISRTNQQNVDATSRIYSDAYNRGLSTFEQTMNQLPTLLSLNQRPITDLAAIGTQKDALGQSILDANISQFNDQQLAPYRALEQYLGFVGNGWGGLGSGSFTGPQSLFGQIFG